MPVSPFTLDLPQTQTTSMVFASPHSGRHYSREFMGQSVLDAQMIRSSEDAFIDTLIACAPKYGAPLLHATYPRAYLDLNRASDELDPAVVEGVRSAAHNPRILSGLGVIPRVVAGGRSIYRGKISRAQADARIETVWTPYHARLHDLLADTHAQFGESTLIDVHSMPHEASEAASVSKAMRPQIVLGDRFGASASGEIVDRIESVFIDAGLRVSRNAPFAGAFIVQQYGRPSQRQNALQIEIDRSLYMDEKTIRPNAKFGAFQKLMEQVVCELTNIGRKTLPLAAE